MIRIVSSICAIGAACGLLLATARAETVWHYSIESSPAGAFTKITGTVSDGGAITSPIAPESNGAFRFAYWDVNGSPAVASTGPALQQVTATVKQDEFTLRAIYLAGTLDADLDGIVDWLEWRTFGSLDKDGSSDPDGDGISAASALRWGYPLGVKNDIKSGGIFRSSSVTVAYHNPSQRYGYRISSIPPGLVSGEGSVEHGKTATSPDLGDAIQGYRLGYWTVNGVRVAGANGCSPTRITFSVLQENTEAVGHFYPENGDTDNDGLLDWDEYRLYGALDQSNDSDADADGYSHGYERSRGYPPAIKDTLVLGGIFRGASQSVTFHNPGAICAYTIKSDPPGVIDQSGQSEAGTILSLPDLFGSVQGNHFACWLVDGEPVRAPDDSSQVANVKVTLNHDNLKIVAKYLPENADSDIDGILDWIEWWRFGGMQEDRSRDPEGDGLDIAYEQNRGYSLTVADSFEQGGVYRGVSKTVSYNNPAIKYRYTVDTDPPGLRFQEGFVDPGAVFTTPNIFGAEQGYTFAFWTVDGVRAVGPHGAAKTQVSVPITHDCQQFSAHYVATSLDSDSDGLPDWFEQRNFADLFQTRQTDADADGISNGTEVDRAYAVRVADTLVDGGVFRVGSGTISYHDPTRWMYYRLTSDPVGFLEQGGLVTSGTTILTPNLPGETQGYILGYWTVNGVRQAGAGGISRTQAAVTLTVDNTQIVGHFFPTGLDSDLDGVPDWWEYRNFGTLSQDSTADPDADGFTVQSERARGYSGALADVMLEGGIFRAASKTITYHDPDIYKLYLFGSDPSGLFLETNLVQPGTLVTTPNLYGATQGYSFGYWTVDGVRQAGSTGIALIKVSLTVQQDTEIIGHFLLTGEDSDADGLQDWWEWFYFGSIAYNNLSNPDGDLFNIAVESARGFNAAIADAVVEGGVFRSASKSIRWHNPGVYVTYLMRSEPEGLLARDEGLVTPGSTVMTPIGHGVTQGYAFAYWKVNGVMQIGPSGRALDRVIVPVSSATEIVAYYTRSGLDSDSDGLDDSYEWTEFGGLAQDKTSDGDGDGVPVGTEVVRAYAARIPDSFLEGGVSRTASQTVNVQLRQYNLYHKLTVTSEPAGMGSVHGGGLYKQGVNAQLEANATPGAGYAFSHWGGDLSGTANPARLAMYSPATVVAYFVQHAAPVAQPDTYTCKPEKTELFDVLANDSSDPAGTLLLASVQQPDDGSIVEISGNLLSFTAAPAFAGTTFTYTAVDQLNLVTTGTVVVSVDSRLETVTLESVAAKGQAVAGQPAGVLFGSFGYPSINDMGELAFQASITGTNGRGTNPVIMSGTAPCRVALRKGMPAPQTTGSFLSFRDPLLNEDGELAVIAKLSGPGVTGSTDYGIWTTLTGTLALVVREGDILTEPQGTVVKTINNVAINQGMVAWTATLLTGTNGTAGPGGATKYNDTGLWVSDGAAKGTQVLREGDTIVLSSGTLVVTTMTPLVGSSPGTGQGRGLADNSQIVVRVSGTGSTHGILAITGTTLSEIAAARSNAPGYGAGAKFSSFGIPSQSTNGNATFLGVAKSGTGGVTASNSVAIYAETSGTLRQVLVKSTAAPGISGTFSAFRDPVINADGQVAFMATVKGPLVTGSTDRVIYVTGTGAPRLIAREGDFAPETDLGSGLAVFKNFVSLAIPDGKSGTLFLADLVKGPSGVAGPGGVFSTNDRGLWGVDSFGSVRLLFREGQTINGKIVATFNILTRTSGSPTQTRWFNANGEAVAKVTFTDHTQAILKISVP